MGLLSLSGTGILSTNNAEQVNSLNLMVFLLRLLQTQRFQTVDFKQRLKELLEA